MRRANGGRGLRGGRGVRKAVLCSAHAWPLRWTRQHMHLLLRRSPSASGDSTLGASGAGLRRAVWKRFIGEVHMCSCFSRAVAAAFVNSQLSIASMVVCPGTRCPLEHPIICGAGYTCSYKHVTCNCFKVERLFCWYGSLFVSSHCRGHNPRIMRRYCIA